MKTKKSMIVGIILILTLLSACSNKKDDIESILKEIKITPLNHEVPDLILPSLMGPDINLKEYVNGSFAFIEVWRSGCKYCRLAAPNTAALAQLASQEDMNMVFLGISRDTDKAAAIAFVNEFKWTFPNMLDLEKQHDTTKALKIVGTPTSFIVSPQGVVIGKIEGFHKYNPQEQIKLFKKLATLL